MHKFIGRYKEDGLLSLCVFLIAGIFLAICSKSSFLYPLNDWVDSNCFFTVGKAIANGEVLYKGIYEQKGPLVYFIHALAYLLSSDSFTGVYIIEVVSFGLFLLFVYKTALLYLCNKKLALFILPLSSTIILTSPSFSHGDSVEEISLCILMFSLYTVLKAIKNSRYLSRTELVLNGVSVACVFWMKYTILGFYIGLIIAVFGWYILGNKIKELGNAILWFIFGFVIVTIPILIYFLYNHSLVDMVEVYFYNNLFLYPIKSDMNRLAIIFNAIKNTIFINKTLFVFVFLGFFGFYLLRKKESVILFVSFLWLVVGTYWGGVTYIYYGLIFSVFSVFGIIFLIYILSTKIQFKTIMSFLLGFTFFGLVLINASYLLSNNTYLMQYKKEDMPQYKFAQIINQVKNPSILNYGFLDGGFYLAADVLPNCRFFCTLNISLEEMEKAQTCYIEEGKGDFIITRDLKLEDTQINSSKYQCISQEAFFFDGRNYTYYLYKHI